LCGSQIGKLLVQVPLVRDVIIVNTAGEKILAWQKITQVVMVSWVRIELMEPIMVLLFMWDLLGQKFHVPKVSGGSGDNGGGIESENEGGVCE
jgi:hypothetical protein